MRYEYAERASRDFYKGGQRPARARSLLASGYWLLATGYWLIAMSPCGGDLYKKIARSAFRLSLLLEATFRWTVASGAKRRMMVSLCEPAASFPINNRQKQSAEMTASAAGAYKNRRRRRHLRLISHISYLISQFFHML